MANYQTSADLVDDVLFRAGEPTDGTSDFEEVALQYVNRAYQALWLGGSEIAPGVNENWWWLYKEQPISLKSPITGTAVVTSGNTTVTIDSTPGQSILDWFFLASGTNDFFRVTSSSSGDVNVTLDLAFTGSSSTGVAFKLFKADYSLATDVLRLATPMRLGRSNGVGSNYQRDGREYQVIGIENREFEEINPIALMTSGIPSIFTQTTEQEVRFNKYGTSGPVRVDYAYIRQPSDLTNSTGDIPAVPHQYRKVISDIATMFLFVDKNDNRAGNASQLAANGVAAMAAENRARVRLYSLAPAPALTLHSPTQDTPTNPEPVIRGR